MTAKSLIVVSDFNFSYLHSKPLFQGLSFRLNAQQAVAVVGPNGSGKSTLLRLVASEGRAFGGAIQTFGSIAYVDQEASNLFSEASGGESRLRAIKGSIDSHPDIWLLDEPTNDLDYRAKQHFMRILRSFRGGVIIVTHDPDILDVVDEIWELKGGKISRHPPGYQLYIDRITQEEMTLRDQIRGRESASIAMKKVAQIEIERHQKKIARGKSKAERTGMSKIEKSAKQRQAQKTSGKLKSVHDKILSKANERLTELYTRSRQISSFKWDTLGARPSPEKILIKATELSMPWFDRSLSFEVRGPKRLQIKGRNGSGKSTILNACGGDLKALSRVSGQITRAPSCKVRIFDQKLGQVQGSMELWRWFRDAIGREVSEARSLLGRLGFEQDDQDTPVSGLSGGEKVRLQMAIALLGTQVLDVLILDEPTNHLDLESHRILEDFVSHFQGAVVVSSHDERFLKAINLDVVIDLDDYCRE